MGTAGWLHSRLLAMNGRNRGKLKQDFFLKMIHAETCLLMGIKGNHEEGNNEGEEITEGVR